MVSCAALLCAPLPVGAAAEGAAAVTAEAEEGTLLGGAAVGGQRGRNWVGNLTQAGDGVAISVTLPADGFWDLTVTSYGQGGYRENYVDVDGRRAGTFSSQASGFGDSTLRRLRLGAGEHTVTLSSYWGWTQIDCIRLSPSEPLPDDLYQVSPALVNPNASDNARRLMHYLCDIYGRQVLSGQYCDQGMFGLENAAIWRATGGQYPALLGLDMIEYSPSRVANGANGRTVGYALDYWEKGGISTFCWHWNAPEPYITGQWYGAFYKENTSFDLKKVMNGQDEAGYQLLLRDIDAISEAMRPLAEADVPILWRPLHEASGGWFWWGSAGKEAYISLYRLMYQRMTEMHGLNNLIWVWNGQSEDWYPGDDVVDIIGWDVYPGEHVYSSQAEIFLRAMGCSGQRKLIWMTENGCIPDPDELFADGTVWGCWCTWGGEFVLKSAGFNALGETYTEKDMLLKAYRDERVVTRATLPDIAAYPLPEAGQEANEANQE